MNVDEIAQLNVNEITQLTIAALIVLAVVILQVRAFRQTKKLIEDLGDFFPDSSDLSVFQSSITEEILISKQKLINFVQNPKPRHQDEEDSALDNTNDYHDVDLIQYRGSGHPSFSEVIVETNTYLCKNVGTSAEFSILQDVCERKVDTLNSQITNSINTPLYLGLAGTFVGIVVGLLGIVTNINGLFDTEGGMSPLKILLIGVMMAMLASLIGLSLMIYNSAVKYKKALGISDRNKNSYFDFLRRELMPTLSNSMAASLNSLRGVLGEFIGKFGHNLDDYANSVELLNDNIKEQHLLLVEVNKMNQTQVSVEMARALKEIKNVTESLGIFRSYQEGLNNTMGRVDESVKRIDDIVQKFDDFTSSLKVVVKNQGAAEELQNQFKTAIETHFPTGNEAREMWRKHYDELSEDAAVVSTELNQQLKASSEYIQAFVNSNKHYFDSISDMKNLFEKLVEYADVQAECYRDLKQEIASLKGTQISTQKNAVELNKDLLVAVREMTLAVKALKK
jgi:hypothetical protein